MFLQHPKKQAKQKHRYVRRFRNTTCPKSCILQCFWTTSLKALVFAVFYACIKHRKYQRIQRSHFPWQQDPKSKNTDVYSVSAQWFFQKHVLFGPFLASEASKNKEGGWKSNAGVLPSDSIMTDIQSLAQERATCSSVRHGKYLSCVIVDSWSFSILNRLISFSSTLFYILSWPVSDPYFYTGSGAGTFQRRSSILVRPCLVPF